MIDAHELDIVVIKKTKKDTMRVKSKENEKIEKYGPLKDEIARIHGVGDVVVITVAVGV